MSIINEYEENICQQAIRIFGIENQIGMLSEECGELLSAINKFKRCRIECKEVTEEIADVIIMCVQMAHYFGYYDVQNEISHKISRLVERMNKINNRVEDETK